MNILDENIREDQHGLLRSWGVPVHQIGVDVGQKGMKDNEIISFLHQLRNTTFFTCDMGFYNCSLCHTRYCLVCLAVEKNEVAVFMRRFLRHSEFDKKAKRMGAVVRASHSGISVWRRNTPEKIGINW